MKRTAARLALILLAALGGWGVGELLLHTARGRGFVGRFVASGGAMRGQAHLRQAAAGEAVQQEEVEREVQLLRDQFGDKQRFSEALAQADLSLGKLRELVTESLRERSWIEKQIAPQLSVSEAELRAFYEQNGARFLQPVRFRAAHLFLAAPDGAPAGVIAAKRSAIEALSIRRIDGEDFAALISSASEDEATKARGGDLNYFSGARMPPEFIASVEKLRVGDISGPVRSHLGFHLVRLTEVKPARPLSFAEARPETALALTNQKRALAVERLRERLGRVEFQRD